MLKNKYSLNNISIESNYKDKLLSLKEQFCNYYCPNKAEIEDWENIF